MRAVWVIVAGLVFGLVPGSSSAAATPVAPLGLLDRDEVTTLEFVGKKGKRKKRARLKRHRIERRARGRIRVIEAFPLHSESTRPLQRYDRVIANRRALKQALGAPEDEADVGRIEAPPEPLEIQPEVAARPEPKALARSEPDAAANEEPSVSCEAAAAIVSDFGFSDVTATSCSGATYAFAAERDGKAYSVKINPADGELAEVQKQ